MEYHIAISDYSSDLLKCIYKLQQKGVLCDAGLECKDGVVYVHKLVLMTCGSAYLEQQVLTGNHNSTRCYISLNDYSLKTVYDLVKTLYTGNLNVLHENMTEMANLCRFLHIEKLESAIASIIQNKINNVDDGSNQNINLSLETDISCEGHNLQYSSNSPQKTQVLNNKVDTEFSVVDSTSEIREYDEKFDELSNCYYGGNPRKHCVKRVKRSSMSKGTPFKKKPRLLIKNIKNETFCADNNDNVDETSNVAELLGIAKNLSTGTDHRPSGNVGGKCIQCKLCNNDFISDLQDRNDPKNIICEECKNMYSGNDTTHIKIERKKMCGRTSKRKQYDPDTLRLAFTAIKEQNISVYSAARFFKVPESTLRDRTRGHVPIQDTSAVFRLFTQDQEETLFSFVKFMSDKGYSYRQKDILNMASEYAFSIGKRSREGKNACGRNWFYGFAKRWPELTNIKGIEEVTKLQEESYFEWLRTTIVHHSLEDRPDSIYCVDDLGVCTDKCPHSIIGENVPGKPTCNTEDVDVIIIGGANVMGSQITPSYVFIGDKWKSDCSIPNNRWLDQNILNSDSIKNYLEDHFLKQVKREGNNPVLILFNTKMSFILLTLADWAKDNNIILMVLPPSSKHCNFQKFDLFSSEDFCNSYEEEFVLFSDSNLSKQAYQNIADNVYQKTVTKENLMLAFSKSGIYPLETGSSEADDS